MPLVVLSLLAALLYPTAVRLRLLDLPLERDEGEYAYAGQLMLDGIPPYELVYNMKFPGIYAAYAAVMGVFGQTVAGIRLGLLLVTTITAVLLYFLGARLFGRAAGTVAAAVYGMLAIAPEAFALHAHATHFIAPFVVGALLLLSKDFTAPRLLGAGALLALGILMKQPALFFAAFAAVYVFLVSRNRTRDVGLLAAGGAIVGALTAAALAAAGVFDRFWFWCVSYAREYVTSLPFSEGVSYLTRNLGGIIGFAPMLWLLAAAGLVFVLQRGSRKQRLMVVGFLIAGALATMPGFYFRHHYFIVLFPALALLAGAAVQLAPAAWPRIAPVTAAIVAIVITVGMSWPRLMDTSSETLTRQMFGLNPFVESPEIAARLRETTQPGDRIVILGSEPQIYFLSDRKSATGYIYAYPLMEEQPFAATMQQEMVRQIEANNPKYVVFVGTSTSWLRKPNSNLTLLDWFSKQSKQWTLDGVVDISEAGTESVWGERAQSYRPRTENFILLYKRAS